MVLVQQYIQNGLLYCHAGVIAKIQPFKGIEFSFENVSQILGIGVDKQHDGTPPQALRKNFAS